MSKFYTVLKFYQKTRNYENLIDLNCKFFYLLLNQYNFETRDKKN